MVKGKPWTVDEIRELQSLVAEGLNRDAICKKMVKTEDSIMQKIYDLHLTLKEEEVAKKKTKIHAFSSSSLLSQRGLKIPQELQSIEEKLKDLVAAKNALKEGGLTRVEILRLSKIIGSCKIYNEDFAKYIDYRELEERLDELEANYAADRAKKKSA